MRAVAVLLGLILAMTVAPPSGAQNASTPAKELFGKASTPAALQPEAIGFYARGCLAGAQALPIDGPAWQAMRLSRNRNWGHPRLVALIERLATEAQRYDGWPGLLVGDMSQPRGGPMLTGHASHQVGLDADIWFLPMPDRRLTEKEREELSAISMLGPDKLSVDPKIWTDAHVRLVKRAASYPEVDRIFVHPAIKKALCEGASKVGSDRSWLRKVRPYWGHHYHFHIRLRCPSDSASCQNQPAPPPGDGCGKELNDWLALIAAPPKPAEPSKPKPPLTLAELPKQCRTVLEASPPSEISAEAPLKVPVPVRAVRGQSAQQ
jgi:penicillin-insensitive murein endopeptidase|nr:MAG: penicillin-insensitive murein endopeptidase [Pseudomonadota bacterium]